MTVTELAEVKLDQSIEKKIMTAIELKKELEAYEKEIKEALAQAMEAYDVDSIKTDTFTASRVTRNTYKPTGEIPKQFQKVVLDTAKVGKSVALYGGVPEGIEKSETTYIAWRAK